MYKFPDVEKYLDGAKLRRSILNNIRSKQHTTHGSCNINLLRNEKSNSNINIEYTANCPGSYHDIINMFSGINIELSVDECENHTQLIGIPKCLTHVMKPPSHSHFIIYFSPKRNNLPYFQMRQSPGCMPTKATLASSYLLLQNGAWVEFEHRNTFYLEWVFIQREAKVPFVLPYANYVKFQLDVSTAYELMNIPSEQNCTHTYSV